MSQMGASGLYCSKRLMMVVRMINPASAKVHARRWMRCSWPGSGVTTCKPGRGQTSLAHSRERVEVAAAYAQHCQRCANQVSLVLLQKRMHHGSHPGRSTLLREQTVERQPRGVPCSFDREGASGIEAVESAIYGQSLLSSGLR